MIPKRFLFKGGLLLLAGNEFRCAKRDFKRNPSYGSLFHTFAHRYHINFTTTTSSRCSNDDNVINDFNGCIIEFPEDFFKCRLESDISSKIYIAGCSRMCWTCKKIACPPNKQYTKSTSIILSSEEYNELPWFSAYDKPPWI